MKQNTEKEIEKIINGLEEGVSFSELVTKQNLNDKKFMSELLEKFNIVWYLPDELLNNREMIDLIIDYGDCDSLLRKNQKLKKDPKIMSKICSEYGFDYIEDDSIEVLKSNEFCNLLISSNPETIKYQLFAEVFEEDCDKMKSFLPKELTSNMAFIEKISKGHPYNLYNIIGIADNTILEDENKMKQLLMNGCIGALDYLPQYKENIEFAIKYVNKYPESIICFDIDFKHNPKFITSFLSSPSLVKETEGGKPDYDSIGDELHDLFELSNSGKIDIKDIIKENKQAKFVWDFYSIEEQNIKEHLYEDKDSLIGRLWRKTTDLEQEKVIADYKISELEKKVEMLQNILLQKENNNELDLPFDNNSSNKKTL